MIHGFALGSFVRWTLRRVPFCPMVSKQLPRSDETAPPFTQSGTGFWAGKRYLISRACYWFHPDGSALVCGREVRSRYSLAPRFWFATSAKSPGSWLMDTRHPGIVSSTVVIGSSRKTSSGWGGSSMYKLFSIHLAFRKWDRGPRVVLMTNTQIKGRQSASFISRNTPFVHGQEL